MKIKYDIHISDIGELERQEQETIALRRALYRGKAIDLENYHTYEEVNLHILFNFVTLSLLLTIGDGLPEWPR